MLSSIRIFFLSFIGQLYISFIYYTCKWDYQNRQVLDSYIGKKPFILCFWHSRLLMIPYTWPRFHPFHMLISSHSDGQLIAHIIRSFNINTIYGSSSKGGSKALRELLQSLKQGITIGITPDGPRGPRQKAKDGIYMLSKIGQVDIIPVVYATSRRKILKTWDRFYLPFPFSKGVFMWGNPIPYPSEKQKDEWLEKLEQIMNQLLQDADYSINGQ